MAKWVESQFDSSFEAIGTANSENVYWYLMGKCRDRWVYSGGSGLLAKVVRVYP